MGHHTKKHRKRTTRRGKYQKISPKKTRRRRQTKRRGGACCSGRPSKNRSSRSSKRSEGRQTIPASQTRRLGAEIAVAIMYEESQKYKGDQDVFFGLTNDKKLEFCRVVLEDKTAAKNAGEGAKGPVAEKLKLDIEKIGTFIKQIES